MSNEIADIGTLRSAAITTVPADKRGPETAALSIPARRIVEMVMYFLVWDQFYSVLAMAKGTQQEQTNLSYQGIIWIIGWLGIQNNMRILLQVSLNGLLGLVETSFVLFHYHA